jgi:hypothetical protein
MLPSALERGVRTEEEAVQDRCPGAVTSRSSTAAGTTPESHFASPRTTVALEITMKSIPGPPDTRLSGYGIRRHSETEAV